MSRTTSQANTKSSSCPLDWVRRDGFLRGTRVLDESKSWYAIGYTVDGTPDGELAFASANPKAHVPTLSRMSVKAGGELIVMDRTIRRELGLDAGKGEVSDSNIGANIGGAAAGATIKGHLHVITVKAVDGLAHSGMGLMLLRRMYDRWYDLTDEMVTDLVTLSGRNVPTEVLAQRIREWEERLRLLKEDKAKADAYRKVASLSV